MLELMKKKKINKAEDLLSAHLSDETKPVQRSECLVLMKFLRGTPEEKKSEVIKRFKDFNYCLKEGIFCSRVEYGFQNSKEKLGAEFEIGFRISFAWKNDACCNDRISAYDPINYGKLCDDLKRIAGSYLEPDEGLLIFNYISNNRGEEYVSDGQYKLYHWVLFRFRDNISPSERQKVISCFLNLRSSLRNGNSYISFIEYGLRSNKVEQNHGFDVVFRVSFSSLSDRDYYVGKQWQNIPDTFDVLHDDFKSFVKEYLEPHNGVLVFDHEVKNYR